MGLSVGAVSLSMVYLLCRGYPLLFVGLRRYDGGFVVLTDHAFTSLHSVCQVGGFFLYLVWLLIATIRMPCILPFLDGGSGGSFWRRTHVVVGLVLALCHCLGGWARG